MKKTVLSLTATVLFTSVMILLNSCSKYEDGPGISLRSAEERVSGDWNVESYTIDGEDQKYWKNSDYLTCVDGFTIFYDEYDEVSTWDWTMNYGGNWTQDISGRYKYVNSTSSYDLCDDIYDYDFYNEKKSGTWKLNSDKTKIDITYNGSPGVETLNILELRETRMKLEGRIDGELHKITLIQK